MENVVMSSRTIEISTEQGALLDEIVDTGLYGNADAVLFEALRGLHGRIVARDAELREEIARGVTGLDGTTLTESEEADLDQFLDGWARIATPGTPP